MGAILLILFFASQVALVCCALHNTCKRHQCPFEDSWLPDPSAYTSGTMSQPSTSVVGSASSVQNALAKYIHRTCPAPYYYGIYLLTLHLQVSWSPLDINNDVKFTTFLYSEQSSLVGVFFPSFNNDNSNCNNPV